MKESTRKFLKNPKNIFLIDGFGALLTVALLFFVLRTFSPYFGLSKTIFEYLSLLALVFAFYSITCFFLITNIWKPYLKIICIANVLYCVVTFGIIFYYYQSISVLGIVYFLGEIIVISGIVFLEIKTIQTPYQVP
ncbi:hypothetical protein [Flavobacterium geliluteum]|uniref:Uncharacterized protein n=1 Tax=Flavobacterium geliluteum TaxID=2816120 RepID=A0A940X5K8_9FLAO|nr:hypothetical protein [Flavobacterium geliluteum]MBP4136834.1 hypothetical protein [Flavobacterium geliluteum]